MVALFKALGDENRLRILNLLMSEKLCVCEIEVLLEMTQSNVSRHLNKLKTVGLIESSKEAQWVHYDVNEVFSRENEELMVFLKHQFETTALYLNDIERYKKYKENQCNCQIIASDKERVIELIK